MAVEDEVGSVPAPILPLCLTLLVAITVEVVWKPGEFPAAFCELSVVEVEPTVLLQPLGLSVQDFPPGSPIAGIAASAMNAAKAAPTVSITMSRLIDCLLSFVQGYPAWNR